MQVCVYLFSGLHLFFFKQKTAYEMRISDWSSDVCSSDLRVDDAQPHPLAGAVDRPVDDIGAVVKAGFARRSAACGLRAGQELAGEDQIGRASCRERVCQYV